MPFLLEESFLISFLYELRFVVPVEHNSFFQKKMCLNAFPLESKTEYFN